MPLDDKLSLLRDRASRALGSNRVQDALTKFRAIIGPAAIPADETVAQAAFEKLRNGEVPTPTELAALEIVVRLMRPVVFSRNGELTDLPDQGTHNLYPDDLKDAWSTFRTNVKAAIPSIGRIETAKRGDHIGTGFLVASNLLATNRHVLGALTFGAEVLEPGMARVVFKQEQGLHNQPSDIVAIEGVAAIHPTLDMVLLKVAAQQRLPIAIETTRIKEGERVAVIGYPGEDPVNNPLFLASVFNGRYGVRRAALGEVLDGSESPVLYHDSSTTQGNSGSPIFSLTTAKVAGIHRAGFFMYRNEAVDADHLLAFVRQAGV
jgi:hypothetical protein